MEPFINKVIFVDETFLEDLDQTSRRGLHEFTHPGLDTRVVSLPLRSPEEIDELTQLIDPSVIRPGSIVVKPGYTDQFIAVDSFSEDLVVRKYDLFVQLCVALGAKRVFVSSIEDVSLKASADAQISAGLGGGAPVGSGEMGFKAQKSSLTDDVRKSIMELRTEAHGAAPDLEMAEELIRKYGLQKDSLFTSMVNMCRGANRLQKHELSLDCSKDVKRVFDDSIEAKIKLMSKFYEGNGNFDRVRNSVESTKSATRLSVVVEF